MYSYIFAAILLIHGLIHIRGYFSGQGLWTIRTFTDGLHFKVASDRSKLLSAVWLLTSAFFSISAVLWALGHPYRGITALIAVIVSQILIFSEWKEAKAGTLVNLILFAFALVQTIESSQKRLISSTVTSWEEEASKQQPVLVSEERIKLLPVSVQNWLRFSGVIEHPVPRFVQIKQKSWMRTGMRDPWMATTADQYFNVTHPSFLWYAKVSRYRLLYFAGVDQLYNNHGHMNIALWSSIPIVSAGGQEIDQGSVLRFLGEMIWFPAAAINPYLKWDSIDNCTAQATMRNGNTQVTGIFYFDAEGKFIRFHAKRYMSKRNKTSLEDWDVLAYEWKSMNGFMLPVAGDVTWHLTEGDFNYYKWQITDVKYE